ncbi:MAG: hypothetical protein ABIR96_01050 [Bdellovibrionota bacterium]
MSSSKTSGNLRDFRIDSRPPTPKNPPHAQNAQQSIKSRASSVTEWEQESSTGFDSESLWKTWEEDLNTQVAPKNATRTASAQIAVREAVAPVQTRETLRRERDASIATRPGVNASLPAQQEILEEEVQSHGPMPWAAELAHTERRMERLGEVEYSTSFKKQEMLKTQTSEFMAVLRHEFARQIETFNEARQSGAQAVHLYRITNTEQDFMLFRNGVKLVVSGQRSGRVLFAFNQFLGQIYTSTQNPNFELEAQWNAFEQLVWTYRNDRVQLQDIIRFFLSEFIRQSYK